MKTVTVPGCAPQLPEHERVQPGGICPTNSWAAAMELVRPKSLPKVPETHIEGLPAFRAEFADAPRGRWSYKCTCGEWHVHNQGEGKRASTCDHHRPHGIYLLAPHGFVPQQIPANTST